VLRESRCSILVAEDNAPLAEFLHQQLLEEQFAVQVVSDAREAEELASNQSYDLVILDLNLPGAAGLDALREIRAKKPDLPVLIVTEAWQRSASADWMPGLTIASRSPSLLRSWPHAFAGSCGEATDKLALFFKLTTWNSIASTAPFTAATGILN
jgi:CheY-like chemotaxis protein